MPIHRSHGEARAENFRVDELPPAPAEAVDAGPERDPNTGRFAKGNAAGRRRKLKRVLRITGVDPASAEAWLKPFVSLAATHAVDLTESLKIDAPALRALAQDVAMSTAVYRGLLALGAQGDRVALAEARAWLRESRQGLIALTGLARQQAGERDPHAIDAEDLEDAAAPRGATP